MFWISSSDVHPECCTRSTLSSRFSWKHCALPLTNFGQTSFSAHNSQTILYRLQTFLFNFLAYTIVGLQRKYSDRVEIIFLNFCKNICFWVPRVKKVVFCLTVLKCFWKVTLFLPKKDTNIQFFYLLYKNCSYEFD